MEPSEIFHTKSILQNKENAYTTLRLLFAMKYLVEEKIFPFSISSDIEWELISDT